MQTVTITTKVVSLNPAHVEVYSIQPYVIKFVSDLRQISGFLLMIIITIILCILQRDIGGDRKLRNTWTGYQKARLDCSIPGEFPIYFDVIRMYLNA
jgi:predicted anti-sigma-YlaC factor YlaD